MILFPIFGGMLRKIIAISILTCLSTFTFAQQRYRDSLEQKLTQVSLSAYEKVMVRCKLARAYFETDLDKALAFTNDAANAPGPDAKAWLYATRTHLLVQKKNKPAAYAALDSALLYVNEAKDPLAKGMVWLRNGWLDIIDNENDLAASKLLKAVDFFKTPAGAPYAALAYHYLASIYSYGTDTTRQAAYAKECYARALDNGEADVLNTAYYTMGQYFHDCYKLNTRQNLLDSALSYYNKSIALSNREKGRIIIRSNTAAVALNTANIYFQHYPSSFRDSVYHYLELAEQIATETRLTEILINCYGIRSEYALRNNNVNEAEELLLTALSEADGSAIKMPLTQSRIYRALVRVAEQKDDARLALSYMKSYVASNEEAFNQEKINNAQKIDARYRSAQQAQKIALLEQEASFREKRNLLYIGLGIAGIAALSFLLISYNYKLKASMRKQELIDKEKEEAILKVKLQEAETNQLIAEQALLRERQLRLEKELLAGQLQKEEKNQIMEILADKNTAGNEEIKKLIKRQQQLDEEYEDHKTDFVEVHASFFEQLQQRAGNSLTRLDMKYCSYILMGLSNKEISTRINIEPKSIRMARYRIKQKLGLGKEDSLDNFIKTLG
ncbi:regulatory protein, luxR family [Chitinophaga filiformis]|uniref:Regulatory protein, luxR family n=1 Tax=Chitinophaga filiformis TaxID=104663 RepID=A0A1G8CHC6_CHIFI|nr:regulatory protein, luxR family [Chitinophaga filiformis]